MDGIGCLFILGIACLIRCVENLEGERRIASVMAAKMCKQMCESHSLCFRCQEKKLQFICRTQRGGNTIEKKRNQHPLPHHSNCSSMVIYINNKGLQCLISRPTMNRPILRQRTKVMLASSTGWRARIYQLRNNTLGKFLYFLNRASQVTYYPKNNSIIFLGYSKRKFGFAYISGELEGVVKHKCLCIACSEDKLFVGTHLKIKTMLPPFKKLKIVKVLQSDPISMAIDLKRSHLYSGLSKVNQILKMTYRGVTITIFHMMRNYDIMFIEPYSNLLYFAGHSRSMITVRSLLTRKQKVSKQVSCKLSSFCIYKGKLFALGYDGSLYVYDEQTDLLLSRHRLSSSSSKRDWSCCLLP